MPRIALKPLLVALVPVMLAAANASGSPPRPGYPDAFKTPSGIVCSPSSDDGSLTCWVLGSRATNGWLLPAFGRAGTSRRRPPAHLPTRTLGYGLTWADNHFSCTSRSSGLRCVQASGAATVTHGFALSRARQREF